MGHDETNERGVSAWFQAERIKNLLLELSFPLTMGFMLGANRVGIAGFMDWHVSVPYWMSIVLMFWLLYSATAWCFTVLARRWFRPPLAVILAVSALFVSIAFRPLVYWHTGLFEGFLLNGRTVGDMQPLQFSLSFLQSHAKLWATPTVFWISANYLLVHVVNVSRFGHSAVRVTRDRPTDLVETPRISNTQSPILQRLEVSSLEDVIALQAQDHYLQVHTRTGSEMILYRFCDAVAELKQANGLRVHRSYWVNLDHVAETRTKGGKTTLAMTNGISVPVSRTFKEIVREAMAPVRVTDLTRQDVGQNRI